MRGCQAKVRVRIGNKEKEREREIEKHVTFRENVMTAEMAMAASSLVEEIKYATLVSNDKIPGQVRRDDRKWWQVRSRGYKFGKLDTAWLPHLRV